MNVYIDILLWWFAISIIAGLVIGRLIHAGKGRDYDK